MSKQKTKCTTHYTKVYRNQIKLAKTITSLAAITSSLRDRQQTLTLLGWKKEKKVDVTKVITTLPIPPNLDPLTICSGTPILRSLCLGVRMWECCFFRRLPRGDWVGFPYSSVGSVSKRLCKRKASC